MFDLNSILRENIRRVKPYSSARDDFSGEASVWIDANENPFNTGINRYPDPHQQEVKRLLAQIKGVDIENLFIGNGSDEIIDLLYRIVCEPSKSNAIILPPTYGMYAVSADINDVVVKKVYLNEDFSPNVEAILNAIDKETRIIFICSPNNPTGSIIPQDVIEKIAASFDGLVVVDEAYIDFAPEATVVGLIDRYPNIYVMQTLSKAWGMAGARLGIGIGSTAIQSVMAKVKAPYNVNILSQQVAVNTLGDVEGFRLKLQTILEEREWLQKELSTIDVVQKVYPSDANFLLVRFIDFHSVFRYLVDNGIVARDRSKEKWCEGCIRLTIGTPDENLFLLETLRTYKMQ